MPHVSTRALQVGQCVSAVDHEPPLHALNLLPPSAQALMEDPSIRLPMTELIFNLPPIENEIYPGFVCKCYGKLKDPAKYVIPRMSFLIDQEVREPKGPVKYWEPASQPRWFIGEGAQTRTPPPNIEINYEPAQQSTPPPMWLCDSPRNAAAQEPSWMDISRGPYVTRGFEDSTRALDSHVDDDVGNLVTDMSLLPFSVNGHFCDVLMGTQKTAGVVALKRPRVGAPDTVRLSFG
ncbi:hypothetical protein M407DRAFT_8104 [Tulasnella calospora MUT 4182]|uniref:Uncharacterized protein n=1 Tax=Tulasnella calospora MUT 4182 TaxID=1051891 RepID=A0A0C3Q864_9AGAM|nr:hypothetical protein M407DRAFT_8104 [Tulasnella calospora MUT 4182]